jgi:DNA invertase Pin-like site-specific DNA recombinase
MAADQRITPEHLSRTAVVYLRQSSDAQVRNNLESQRLQYAMQDRARRLGFEKVEVIDADLGASAAVAAAQREGFQRLLGAVACGEVGIVLSRELSRLLRTDRDFCQLVELCQAFGALIADEQAVYDASRMDDQLVLGIKATMSVAELKVIRMRLDAGKENKARRGELYSRLPPGYILSPTQDITKDPNVRVQEAMGLIFSKFRETWSVRQTFKWFLDNNVELPVTKVVDGKVLVIFQRPCHSFVASVLHNPIYAGAYVWGRRRTAVRWSDGRLHKRQGPISRPEEARVFLKDHHESYIDWLTFEENQKMIERNDRRSTPDPAAGAVRAGKGLLSGLLRCGRCGRKLHVRYWGKAGTNARYLCRGQHASAGASKCVGFGGTTVDRRFGQEVLRAISPLGVRASLTALERLSSTENERRRVLERQLEQLEYEADRAFAQYDAVDPRNTLVAPELQRRWNEKLEQVDTSRRALNELAQESVAVTAEQAALLRALGANFAEAWNDPACPPELKKKIVRTVVEEVVVDEKPAGVLSLTIHWKGGSHTAFTMPRPDARTVQRTADADLDVIRKMAARYGDGAIASVLNKSGRRTGKGHPWSQQSVASARRAYDIEGRSRTVEDPEILTLQGAVRHTGVSDRTIKKLVDAGVLAMHQVVPCAPWEIRRTDLDCPRVRQALDGLERSGRLWLGDTLTAQPGLFPSDGPETQE